MVLGPSRGDENRDELAGLLIFVLTFPNHVDILLSCPIEAPRPFLNSDYQDVVDHPKCEEYVAPIVIPVEPPTDVTTDGVGTTNSLVDLIWLRLSAKSGAE